MNIHELDRRLIFGDQRQIAVVNAMEAGAVLCDVCGVLMDPADFEDCDPGAPIRCYRCLGAARFPLKLMRSEAVA